MRNSEPDYSSLESHFYIALGRYMQTFSYLELNLGLCIRWLVNRNDVKVAHPLLNIDSIVIAFICGKGSSPARDCRRVRLQTLSLGL